MNTIEKFTNTKVFNEGISGEPVSGSDAPKAFQGPTNIPGHVHFVFYSFIVRV